MKIKRNFGSGKTVFGLSRIRIQAFSETESALEPFKILDPTRKDPDPDTQPWLK